MPIGTSRRCQLLEIESPIPISTLNFLKPEASIRLTESGSRLWSDESGNDEIYVRPALPTGGKLLVSRSGGSRPKWRRDGKEIFYLSATSELMAAKVRQNGSFLEIDTATRLAKARTESFLPSL